MNTFSGPIDADGLVLRVAIGLSATMTSGFQRAGRAVPQPAVIDALIDTGADVTVIDRRVIASFTRHGLTQHRFVLLNAPAAGVRVVAGGVGVTSEYLVGMSLPHGSAAPLRLRTFPVLEGDLSSLGYDAVIGRDVLAHCTLFYDGPGRRFTLGC